MDTQIRSYFRGRFSVEGRRLFAFFPCGKRSQLLYENTKPFYEVFEPYCFEESLETHAVSFYFEHDPEQALGSTETNARIKEEMVGLKVRIDIPNGRLGDRVLNLAADGRLGISPGFKEVEGSWENRYGVNLRTIKKATLYELSFTVLPAYIDSATCFQIPSTRHVEEPPGRETSVIVSDGMFGFPVEERTFWGVFRDEGWGEK
jgi:HK97 family phage prohead protease